MLPVAWSGGVVTGVATSGMARENRGRMLAAAFVIETDADPAGNDIVAISMAEDQTIALKRDGRVLSWGEERDALGRPTPDDDEGEQPGLIP